MDNGQCVQSGFCCMQGPCRHGASIDDNNPQCVHLAEPDSTGRRKCLIYDEIKQYDETTEYPMFGSGCSSTLFNTMRDIIIKSSIG